MFTAYIYPSNLGIDGQDMAIAFDDEEFESLVKILKKVGGPIAKNLIQVFEIDQNDWGCLSFHGRFICDKCGKEHIGVNFLQNCLEKNILIARVQLRNWRKSRFKILSYY